MHCITSSESLKTWSSVFPLPIWNIALCKFEAGKYKDIAKARVTWELYGKYPKSSSGVDIDAFCDIIQQAKLLLKKDNKMSTNSRQDEI